MTTADPVQLVLSRLEGVKVQSETQWIARCPCHDDRKPSLSIAIGDKQPVVFKCMAGCENNDILAAMDLTWTDILGASPNGQKRERRASWPAAYPTFELAVAAAERQTHGKPSGTWTYRHANGDEHFRVVRFDQSNGKTFRPFHRTDRGWVQTDPPGELSLYRLPDLLLDDELEVVYLFEGERCVEAARKLGLTATTSAHGCKSPKKSDWAVLAGKQVVAMPDNDSGGRKYAQTSAGILTSLDPPASVKIVSLPDLEDHGDIVDFIKDRRMNAKDNDAIRAELSALAEQAPVWTPGVSAIARKPYAETALEPYRAGESMRAINRMSGTARQLREMGSTLAEQVAEWLDRRGPETLDGIDYPIPYAAKAIGVSRCHFHRLGQIGRVRRCCAARNTPLALSDRAIVPLARLLTDHPEAIPQAVQAAAELTKAESNHKGLDKPKPVNKRHTSAAVDEIIGPAPKHTPVRRRPSPDPDTAVCEGVREQISDLAAAAAAVTTIPADVRMMIAELAKHPWSRQ